MKPLVLKVSEVSKLLQVHRTKVYLLIETGALSGYKIGGDWRIRTDSLEKLIGRIPEEMFNDFQKAA